MDQIAIPSGITFTDVVFEDIDNDGDADFFAMNKIGDSYYYENLTIVSSILNSEVSIEVNVYPNPVNNKAIVQFENNNHTEFTFNLYAANGQLLLSRKTQSDNLVIDASSFSKGVYLFELLSNEERGSGKFLVE